MAREITLPGLVDPHVHLRGMAWAHKATFGSETAAALAGGYTAVLDMPNTPPATITAAALARKLAEFGAQAVCDWGVYFGASQDDNSAAYAEVADRVCGLKIYNNATTGTLLIADQGQRARHYAAWPGQRPIAVHAEGKTVLDILALVRQYGRRTHFCHISTAEEIGYLTAARQEGLPVTVGVCPHHLYLTQDDLGALGPLGLMKPELKTRADRDALWAALTAGVVDVVESDHAPHTLAEKYSGQPVYGVPGLETTLPLMLLAVQQGRLTLEQVAALLSENPRRIFGIAPHAGTYAIVEVDTPFTIERANLRTACGWSPFEGMRVYGRVKAVSLRGVLVYDGECVLAESGSGQNLFGGAV